MNVCYDISSYDRCHSQPSDLPIPLDISFLEYLLEFLGFDQIRFVGLQTSRQSLITHHSPHAALPLSYQAWYQVPVIQ